VKTGETQVLKEDNKGKALSCLLIESSLVTPSSLPSLEEGKLANLSEKRHWEHARRAFPFPQGNQRGKKAEALLEGTIRGKIGKKKEIELFRLIFKSRTGMAEGPKRFPLKGGGIRYFCAGENQP